MSRKIEKGLMAALEFFVTLRDECEGKSQEEIQGLLN